MNRREKIIVGLVIVAAIGAAIDYLLPSLTAPSTVQTQARDADIPAAIQAANVELADLRLSPGRQEILDQYDEPWRPDLLLRRSTVDEDEAVPTNRHASFAYTAFLKIGGKPLAIINGRDYAEGDWLEGEVFQIGKIAATETELIPRNGDEPIFIPIDSDPQESRFNQNETNL